MWIEGSSITGNTSGTEAGEARGGPFFGRDGDGGGIFIVSATQQRPIHIEDTTFANNQAATNGGAISYVGASSYGRLEVRGSTFDTNTADNDGGAIAFYSENLDRGGRGGGSTLTLENSTLVGNNAEDGGGIHANGGQQIVRHSTLTGNTAADQGGALFTSSNSVVAVDNSTLATNAADAGGGIYQDSFDGTVALRSSIVFGNTAPGGDPDIQSPALRGFGAAFNSVFSLIGDVGSADLVEHYPGTSKFGDNPALQPLANNGGNTQTQALGAGSAALDAGLNVAPSGRDQRRDTFTRIIDGQADIGAYEGATTPLVSISVIDSPLAEAGGMASFVLQLSEVSGNHVTVGLALSGTAIGTDYDAEAVAAVIPAGTLETTVVITGIDDVIEEPDETVIADIDTVVNATEDGVQQATAVIVDDEPPLVTLTVEPPQIDEEGGIAVITATLSNPHTDPVTVNLGVSGTATGGADFMLNTMSILIPAGQVSGEAEIEAFLDAEADDMETVIIDIDSVVNGVEDGVQVGQTTIVEMGGGINILEIPTLSTVGKWAMALMTSMLGLFVIRRRG